MKRKSNIIILTFIAAALFMSGCGYDKERYPGGVVKVYNWGEYIDEDVIAQFEEETGIHVIYDTYETNEEMFPIIEAGGVSYDALCRCV